jgi:hypothetical protein
MKIRCSFLFLGVFCTSLANRVSNTWRNSEFLICNYEWLIIFYREGGLLSKLQHFKASNILWIKKATSVAVPLTMTKLEPNRNERKTEKPKIHGYNKLFPKHLPLQPLGNFGQVAACWSSSANRGIISLFATETRHSPIWSRSWTRLVFKEIECHTLFTRLSKRTGIKILILTEHARAALDQFHDLRNLGGSLSLSFHYYKHTASL